MSDHITYGGVTFLRHKDAYEVRKGKTDTIMYYTRQDTGESGMSVQSLANACGVAQPSLLQLLKTFVFEGIGKYDKITPNDLNYEEKKGIGKPHDFYLIEVSDAHVVRDIYCERVIYYYAFESHYKKTKARELYQSLAQHGLRSFIQSKTGYQVANAPQHDASLVLSIEEQLRKENEELKLQLVAKDEAIQQQATEIHNLKYNPCLEKTYQAYLHGVLGGTREFHVSGPYPGRIDIATDHMIVEVKRAVDFEKAFGQLLRYRAQLQNTEHATKTYSIFLFGNVTAPEREVLETMADMTSFQLMIHKDLQDYVDEDELSIRQKIRVVS